MISKSLKDLLLRHEGLRLKPYTDTVGKLTIGVGRNLTDKGISESEAMLMFENDINSVLSRLRTTFYDYDKWAQARQDALADMMFNLGPAGFAGFRRMIAAVLGGDWKLAASHMRNSLWARQLPARVEELATMVETGDYDAGN